MNRKKPKEVKKKQNKQKTHDFTPNGLDWKGSQGS